jgi:hypothetical protein
MLNARHINDFVPNAQLAYKAGCATADYHAQPNTAHSVKLVAGSWFPDFHYMQ